MVKRGKDNLTMDLFTDWQPPEVMIAFPDEVTKGATLDVKISKAVSEAMQSSGKGRDVIAAEMSEYLGGQNVTVNMLDTYASAARRDHKITLERLIALVHVTECYELLNFVCDFHDCIVVPKKYGDIIQLWLAEERQAEIDRTVNSLRTKVRSGR